MSAPPEPQYFDSAVLRVKTCGNLLAWDAQSRRCTVATH